MPLDAETATTPAGGVPLDKAAGVVDNPGTGSARPRSFAPIEGVRLDPPADGGAGRGPGRTRTADAVKSWTEGRQFEVASALSGMEPRQRPFRPPPEADGLDRGSSQGGPMGKTIVAREIHKWFGSGRDRTPIVRDVSLSVGAGETVFLVGPSGSGKTTLLSILGCILTPDQGAVEVLGHDITRMRREDVAVFRREHLGFIFQTFNLFPTLSALDNVRIALALRGVPRPAARSRAAALLDRVGLSHRLRTMPTRLSTGECQRVAIARALAGDPKVLLADEPTASLDAENGQAVMQMLSGLAKGGGLTLLIVTHDNRIVPFADRILRLEDGHLAGPEGGVVVPHFHQGGTPKEAMA